MARQAEKQQGHNLKRKNIDHIQGRGSMFRFIFLFPFSLASMTQSKNQFPPLTHRL